MSPLSPTHAAPLGCSSSGSCDCATNSILSTLSSRVPTNHQTSQRSSFLDASRRTSIICHHPRVTLLLDGLSDFRPFLALEFFSDFPRGPRELNPDLRPRKFTDEDLLDDEIHDEFVKSTTAFPGGSRPRSESGVGSGFPLELIPGKTSRLRMRAQKNARSISVRGKKKRHQNQ